MKLKNRQTDNQQIETYANENHLYNEQKLRAYYLLHIGHKVKNILSKKLYSKISITAEQIKTWGQLTQMLSNIHCDFEGVPYTTLTPSETNAMSTFLKSTGWVKYKARFFNIPAQSKLRK
tara:strand:- start:302 stop:661 length:360 start_codon:yes stop_codon:yes gene_type:complete